MGDDYSALNIARPGEAVFRDKVVGRLTAIACAAMTLFAGALSVGAAVNASVGASVGLAAAALFFLYVGLTRSVMRTVLTPSELRIQWGTQTVAVPLGAIRKVHIQQSGRGNAVEAMRESGSPPIEFFDLGVTRYAASQGPVKKGSFGHVVDIIWNDLKTGKERRMWLAVDDPDGLFSAIQSGRGKAAVQVRVESGGVPTRVASPETALEEAESEASAENEVSPNKKNQRPFTG